MYELNADVLQHGCALVTLAATTGQNSTCSAVHALHKAVGIELLRCRMRGIALDRTRLVLAAAQIGTKSIFAK